MDATFTNVNLNPTNNRKFSVMPRYLHKTLCEFRVVSSVAVGLLVAASREINDCCGRSWNKWGVFSSFSTMSSEWRAPPTTRHVGVLYKR